MSNGTGQVNMSQPLTPNFTWNNLNTTFFTNDATMFHPLVLTAITFVIFGWTKNLGAKKPITLRLKGSVIDGFRFFHFTERTLTDLFR